MGEVRPLGGHSLVEGLEKLKLLLEAISGGEYCCLRHGLPCIRVGDLVEQSICEYRVHLKMMKGVLSEKAVQRDLRLLAELTVGARRRLKRVSEGRVFIATPLAAVLEGVPMVGRPDLVIAEEGDVVGVVWCKITERPSRVTAADRLRVHVLGLLVDYSPLPSVDELRLVLVASRTKAGIEEGLRTLKEQIKPTVAGESWIHVMMYSRDYALRMVFPLLAYWKELRGPRASPSPSRCSSCPFSAECPWSAAPRNRNERAP